MQMNTNIFATYRDNSNCFYLADKKGPPNIDTSLDLITAQSLCTIEVSAYGDLTRGAYMRTSYRAYPSDQSVKCVHCFGWA